MTKATAETPLSETEAAAHQRARAQTYAARFVQVATEAIEFRQAD